MLDQRGQFVRAAVGFATLPLPSYNRAPHTLRTWLDSWSGIGHVTVGMARQGYDLQLTQYDERGWRAMFYTSGMEHSPTSATGTAWGAHAVACDAAGGVGGIVRGILDDEIALTPGNFFSEPVSILLERHRLVVAGVHRSLCVLDVASSRCEHWCGISVALLRALRTTRGRCVAG